jgi:hypothetical protein
MKRLALLIVFFSLALAPISAMSAVQGDVDSNGALDVARGGTNAGSAQAGFDNLKQPATADYPGVVELATEAETVTGTDAQRAVTPAGLTSKMAEPGMVGTVYRGSSRTAIDTAIAGGARSVELTGNIALASDWDLSGFTGRFVANGYQISGAYTFTVPDDFVGSTNCFGSTLTVAGLTESHPKYWGFSSVSTAAVNGAALNSAAAAARNIILPSGQYYYSQTIPLNDNGHRLVGAGRGPGAKDGSSAEKDSPTILIWAGAINTPMIQVGKDAGASICWGVTIEGMELDGNNVAGVRGIDFLPKAANPTVRDVAITRTVDTGIYLADTVWNPTIERVTFGDFDGVGTDFRGSNHNAKLLYCQFHHGEDAAPTVGARFGVESSMSGVQIIGCDFEPGAAPVFLEILNTSAVTIHGGYHEARNAATQSFIKLGDTAANTGVRGASIRGVTFQGGLGGPFAEQAILVQGPSENIVAETNSAWGIGTAFITDETTNSCPGCWEGSNSVTTTPLLVSPAGRSINWHSKTVESINVTGYQDVAGEDTGDASARAITITPETSYVRITCSDTNGGCTGVLSETGAVTGQVVDIECMAANPTVFSDSAGVQEMIGGSAFSCVTLDVLSFRYNGTRWVELFGKKDTP